MTKKVQNHLTTELPSGEDGFRTVYKSNRGRTLSIKFTYPDENPKNSIEETTELLTYLGMFEGFK